MDIEARFLALSLSKGRIGTGICASGRRLGPLSWGRGAGGRRRRRRIKFPICVKA